MQDLSILSKNALQVHSQTVFNRTKASNVCVACAKPLLFCDVFVLVFFCLFSTVFVRFIGINVIKSLVNEKRLNNAEGVNTGE